MDRTRSSLVRTIDDDVIASGIDDLLLRTVLHGEIPAFVVVAREYPHVPLTEFVGERLMDLAEEARARRRVKIHEHDTSLLLLEQTKMVERITSAGPTCSVRRAEVRLSIEALCVRMTLTFDSFKRRASFAII